MSQTFKLGDEVQRISDPTQIGTIVEIREFYGGVQYYRVSFGGGHRPRIQGTDLQIYAPADDPVSALIKGPLTGAEDFQRLITQQRLLRDHPLRNNIYAFNTSRIRFYPYQFKPLLKFLDSPQNRLLIADEVGLGKTIEAGLILLELKARQTFQRVLIVCPAALRDKWQMELKRRFGEQFTRHSKKTFIEFLDEYENYPDTTEFAGIVSYESVRLADSLARLEEIGPDFDLVIFDEAHHMRNFGTKTRRAGQQLCTGARSVLFLTATPVQTGSENLFSLLNLLDDVEFPSVYTFEDRRFSNEPIVKAQMCIAQIPPKIDEALRLLEDTRGQNWLVGNPAYPVVLERLKSWKEAGATHQLHAGDLVETQRDLEDLNLFGHIFTRTKKKLVQEHVVKRKAFAIEVELSPIEKDFYGLVTDFVRMENERRHDSALIQSWLLNMPQRRMASCIPAMVDYYRNHDGLGSGDRSEDDQPEPENAGVLFEKQDLAGIKSELGRVIETWPEQGHDSKYDSFIKILRELRDQEGPCSVMLFAFFKQTLHYLRRRLEQDGFKTILITGDVPPSERSILIERFRTDREIEVLLSSRVGTEGLDFQFCNVLVNYDLPWNPMEIEQRIGRLDRIGQDSEVIRIYNMWAMGTIEQRILQRLYERIGVFERSVGELEVILGDTVRSLERDILSKRLTPAEEEERLRQTELALEQGIQELEALERDAAKFIGTDVFFEDEVDKIQKNRRYVTADQLRRYLFDFLRREFPKTRFERDVAPNRDRMWPSSELLSFLQRRPSVELAPILQAGDRGIDVTFVSNEAFDDPHLEFLNVLHPFVQAIARFYLEDPAKLSLAHWVRLDSGGVEPGLYFYFIYRLTVTSAKSYSTLNAVFLADDGSVVIEGDDAEKLLGELVEGAVTPHGAGIEVDEEAAHEAARRSEGLFLENAHSLQTKLARHNDAFIDRRLRSLESFYGKSIAQQESLLARGRRDKRAEQYLRLRKGIIRRLQGELATKQQDVERLRTVAVEYDCIGAGVLEAT